MIDIENKTDIVGYVNSKPLYTMVVVYIHTTKVSNHIDISFYISVLIDY